MQEGAPGGRGRVRVELGGSFLPSPFRGFAAPFLSQWERRYYAITFRPRATVVLWPTTALLDFARIVSTNSQSLDTFSAVIVSAM